MIQYVARAVYRVERLAVCNPAVSIRCMFNRLAHDVSYISNIFPFIIIRICDFDDPLDTFAAPSIFCKLHELFARHRFQLFIHVIRLLARLLAPFLNVSFAAAERIQYRDDMLAYLPLVIRTRTRGFKNVAFIENNTSMLFLTAAYERDEFTRLALFER